MPHPDWLTRRPIAHRGLHDMNRTRFENTLSAFDAAVAGNFAIECDVVLSRDGVAMVHHDLTLERLAGDKRAAIDVTSAEMEQMAIGGTADRIPSLAEALARLAGRVGIVIELKGHDDGNTDLVSAVARALSGYGGPAAIMSFDPWLVAAFPHLAPGIAAGLTAEGETEAEFAAHEQAMHDGISFISYNVDHLPNPFVARARRERGLKAITWTVRTRDQMAVSATHADQITFEGFDPDAP